MNRFIGMIVKSEAGRDKGTFHVAVGADDRCVYICDGKERKLEKPKRKNVKHISPTDIRIELSEMTNRKLRRLITEFKTQNSGKADR